MNDGPIAMFDSGFGGLTVARAVMDLLPGEQLVYLGDTARARRDYEALLRECSPDGTDGYGNIVVSVQQRLKTLPRQ